MESHLVNFKTEMRFNSKVGASVPCTLRILFCFALLLSSLEPELTSHLFLWLLCTWQPEEHRAGQWENNMLGPISSFYLSL